MNYAIKFPQTNAAVSKASFDVCGGSDNLVITTKIEEMFFHSQLSVITQRKKLLEQLYDIKLEVAALELTTVDFDLNVDVVEPESVWRSATDSPEIWNPEEYSYLQPPF